MVLLQVVLPPTYIPTSIPLRNQGMASYHEYLDEDLQCIIILTITSTLPHAVCQFVTIQHFITTARQSLQCMDILVSISTFFQSSHLSLHLCVCVNITLQHFITQVYSFKRIVISILSKALVFEGWPVLLHFFPEQSMALQYF